ncbi:mediator of RNA polymerase II transcription subunit 34 isoform X2 [Citrus clementina]|nr:mediator of RNA polymerase II transcription subunit 34 isoform X2 [Citrus x clementina]
METEEILQELENVEAEVRLVQEQIKQLVDRQDQLYERQSELKSLLEAFEASRGSPIQYGGSSSTAVENWSGTFEWDSRADDVRLNVFGIPAYRANQQEIINAVLSGRDVLVIMAAGGGKSLCYQLPAVLREGIALVVSPLLSLIQDQVMCLAALGIPAHMLTSTTSKEDEKFIYKALEKGEGELKMLYVTPEKISKSKRFMSKLEKCHHAGRLSLISIDEAHCCSQWGHDFRPDYKNLGILKTQFPDVPMMALTATATQKVQNDLMEMLHIRKCIKFVSTINRPNLFYMVREKSSVGKVVIDEIAKYIQESYPNSESGIVYCFSRKECEQVAQELRQRGISADYYHADMDINAREKVHMRWSKNKLQVIVGTVAFGMGINKPDVRFVIHHSLSKSVETYYQESGRAGRDGLPSECLLFFRPADVPRQSSMVFYENSGLQNLYDIVRYSQSKKQCRRSTFFRHFAEPLQDCNGHAQCIISLLQDIQDNNQRLTMLQLVDKMKIKLKEIDSDLKREEIEQLVLQLIIDRVLSEEFQHTAYSTNAYVTIGPLAKLVLQGKKIIKLEISSVQKNTADNKKSTKRSLTSSALEFELDELRKELASISGGILPHSVLSSQLIRLISARKPSTMEELEKIIGKLKTGKYGSRILEVISKCGNSEQQHDNNAVSKEEQGRGARASKRTKKEKAVVVVDSSDDSEV